MIAYIEDIARHEGETVTLRGWLHNRRSSGKIHFLTVRDGSGFIQCVMSKKAVGDETFTRADHLSQESAVSVEGTVRADTRAPGGYEIDVTTFDIISGATDYQIERKPVGVDNVATGRGRVVALLAQAAERFKLMPCGEALPEVENQVVPVAASRPA